MHLAPSKTVEPACILTLSPPLVFAAPATTVCNIVHENICSIGLLGLMMHSSDAVPATS